MRDIVQKSWVLLGVSKRSRWLAMMGMSIVKSGLEALGAVLVFALLGQVSSGSDTVPTLPLVGRIDRFFPSSARSDLLTWTAVAIGVYFVLRAGFFVFERYVAHRVSENTGAALSARLFHGYLSAPYLFHASHNSAELVRNVFVSIQHLVAKVFLPLSTIIAETFLILGMMGVLVVVAPWATLMATVVLGLSVGLLLQVIKPRFRRLGADRQTYVQSSLQALNQGFDGIREIRVMAKERFFTAMYAPHRYGLAKVEYQRGIGAYLPRVLLETTLLLFILAFLIVIVRTQGSAQDAIATLGLFAYAGLRLQPSLQRLASTLNDLEYARAAIDDVYNDLMRFESLIPGVEQDREPLPFREVLELDDVTMRYEGTEQDAVSHVDLRIRTGEWLGIVGGTGGGKTTMIDLLAGLLEPTGGTIRADGQDIHSDVRRWHRTVGIVPQATFLIDDTLRANIALGVKRNKVDEEHLSEVVRLAQLDDVVDQLPDGLDTFVGERGGRFSGGQRQRIAIARALYRDPELLIFDEATSALDNVTEASLMGAIDGLRGHKTMVMVAHRLSTVEHCDRIIMLEAGRIVAEGPYHELLESSSAFRRLATVTG